ncbi:tyrosine-type recombinase/integrase [Maritalea porphyrae]|uniref:tyrosine-type recombinase/integrase n=1 Tax=Maritalea porphyrae TaxID=880732 RepID=UPI0022B07DA0|nr:site-specific integrase [Maritalea porphyrae]MCZ4273379.1 tyrosine-type recombinase/integrase [Maritalea porphyrae]
MRKKLTTKTIDALPAAVGKRYEVRDMLLAGFMVRVSSVGKKVFYLNSRIEGRSRRIKIGEYPMMSLAEARQKAQGILRDISLGEFENNGTGSPERSVPTLQEVIEQFIELYAKPRNKDWKGTQSVLRKFSTLNSRPIDQINRRDVHQVLDRIVASGTPTRANRALAAVKKLMNWAVDRGYIGVSPIASLKPPTKEVPRERVLTDDEVCGCWTGAIEEGYPFTQFVHILTLLGQRRGEVAGMRWSELDLEKGLWTLPSSRAKNGTAHFVPLPKLALSVLNSIPRFLNSDLVFTTTGTSPISGFGRLKQRLDVHVGLDAPDWRFHDLRRTMATGMAELRFAPHIIEAILNHKSGIVSGVAAVYNRHLYLDEKLEALELWANKIETLTSSLAKPADKKLATSLAS